ncbi:hypothetical protein HH214_04350 [Mucilaginibacter robiniae]|uniref:Uncharacterized protein n=1 Tax=Mucilaginibacter robiniae TaxID=2728022 RepID=A0A7L5E0U9_9SPHI|nr:hypothetical protein [Mucilaginibacter robiniae]QJD95164.1 hypothetical protein HH214_04350 [Mucilaginibacter robiniae]
MIELNNNVTPASGWGIIAPSIFQQYEDISVNIKPERLKVFIKKAQELDLKPFLGHALYYELIKWFTADGILSDNMPPKYQDLYKGCTYTDPQGYEIIYEGLTPAMVYFTFARFIESNAVHYTPTGPVIKRYDNAEPLSASAIVKLVQQQRSIANAHVNEVEKFLLDKQADYPLWFFNSKNKSARQAGPRIRGIDRTDFNYPSGNNDAVNLNTLNNFLTDAY